MHSENENLKDYRSITLKKAREEYQVSKRQGGYSINGFKSRVSEIMVDVRSRQTAVIFAQRDDDHKIYLPNLINNTSVCHYLVGLIPDNAIVFRGAGHR